MSSDNDPLFSGVEESQARQSATTTSRQPPLGMLKPGEAVKAWLRGLSYDEFHGFIVGFVPWFLASVTGDPLLLAVAVGLTAAAIGHVQADIRVLRLVVRKSWYAFGGGVLGWVLGASILAWTQIYRALEALLSLL